MQVENDASAAAVAELVQGVGTRYEDFLHISLTTFIGAGLVIDGTLQTGPHGNTAAFGPFPVAPSSLASVPKPSGPFEILLHRASIYTLVNHLRLGGVEITRSPRSGSFAAASCAARFGVAGRLRRSARSGDYRGDRGGRHRSRRDRRAPSAFTAPRYGCARARPVLESSAGRVDCTGNPPGLTGSKSVSDRRELVADLLSVWPRQGRTYEEGAGKETADGWFDILVEPTDPRRVSPEHLLRADFEPRRRKGRISATASGRISLS